MLDGLNLIHAVFSKKLYSHGLARNFKIIARKLFANLGIIE